MPDFKAFAESLGISFNNLDLLVEALTHRSYINEHKSAKNHNERLEFLGDAVLELATTRFLYDRFPGVAEGELTAYRAALVNTNSIGDAAETLGVNDQLLLSKGEKKDTGRARKIILANAFEAIIGAIYLDQGYDAAEAFIAKNLYHKLDPVIEGKTYQDAKSKYQELAQEKRGITPRYQTLDESGPDHDRHFTVGIFLHEKQVGQGEGKSKQEAEQAAAGNAIDKSGW